MKNKICIGSRESRLAVIQSQMVQNTIKAACPGLEVELLTMKTTGDKILDRTLDQVGGKGLFVKELDRALQERRSDLSVHSLKDVPMEVPEELPLLAFSKREDPRDVLVLPEGAVQRDNSLPIGCSSRRRVLQLQALFPEAVFAPVRGNLQTRLKKLEEGQYGALVLAAAGLKRLGLEHRISRYFTVQEVIPAAGQGILAVQGRAGEDYSFVTCCDDAAARTAALAERAFVRELNGGCSSPVAAHAIVDGDQLELLGLYYDEETGAYLRGSMKGAVKEAEALGKRLAISLREQEEMRKRMQDKVQGKVWLVGAGPGDPGLFTIKGREVLSRAEVVVYDALVGQSILGMIPEDAEQINVGKRASNHIMAQEDINRVLLRKALEGKRVVRLKGGDPFLFGRGGEELELLAEHQIPFEVVPGVTSALAVPAYNGIPVTHRDYCSSLHIVTGHKRKGERYDIDFEALVRTRGTLIFLMGIAALGDICRGLLEAGMDPEMPAAVLQQGTTAGQKRIVAAVSTLEAEVQRQGVETPAIIVVGKVCRLAEDFYWFERKPLAGRKILVTRPKELVSEMSRLLREQGAEVLELPAIRTVPIHPNPRLEECLKHAEKYEWIVFTSPTGVRVFFEELKEVSDIRKIAGARFAVIGSGTKKALLERGIHPDLMPETFDGRSLGQELAKICESGTGILIPRAAIGTRELTEELEKVSGICIDDIPTYDTIYEKSSMIDEKAEFENGRIDYAVFTSASTVKGFARAVKDLDFSKVRAVCIGKQTQAAAAALGMQTWVAKKATMEAVVERLMELASGE